jgi:endonuclease/exonuclease/phosphatase family metal-dependent hydrolase
MYGQVQNGVSCARLHTPLISCIVVVVRSVLLLMAIVAVSACRTGRNYSAPEGPRYAGEAGAGTASGGEPDTILVVSFNIEFALRVDSALALLASEPVLRGADVLLLQEMNGEATRRIAQGLGMWYVYYPAFFHFRTDRDVGNAILSRWPIVEDRKIVLPHLSRFVRTQRTATAATIQIGQVRVRVYSTHLGTMGDLAPSARREQLRAIIADAEQYPRVIIGGDMNDVRVGEVAEQRGFEWPTEHGPETTRLGRLDHIFLRGLRRPERGAAGTLLDVRGASDHLPVWAVALIEDRQ